MNNDIKYVFISLSFLKKNKKIYLYKNNNNSN